MFLGVNVQTHFFSFFAPMFVAFASMILLSYSSFECLSHTPYLKGQKLLAQGGH